MIVHADLGLVREDTHWIMTWNEFCEIVFLHHVNTSLVVDWNNVGFWLFLFSSVSAKHNYIHWRVKLDVVANLHDWVNFGQFKTDNGQTSRMKSLHIVTNATFVTIVFARVDKRRANAFDWLLKSTKCKIEFNRIVDAYNPLDIALAVFKIYELQVKKLCFLVVHRSTGDQRLEAYSCFVGGKEVLADFAISVIFTNFFLGKSNHRISFFLFNF